MAILHYMSAILCLVVGPLDLIYRLRLRHLMTVSICVSLKNSLLS